jgi:hypothetical protein
VPPFPLVFLRVSRVLVAFVFCAVILANPSEHVLELDGYYSVVGSSLEGKKLQSPRTTCSMVPVLWYKIMPKGQKKEDKKLRTLYLQQVFVKLKDAKVAPNH